MLLTRRIYGVMEEQNFPVASGCTQLFLKPVDLILVHVIAVERKKANPVLWLEGIVATPIHIEGLIFLLQRGIVMISQSRIKLHAIHEQRSIRPFELLRKVT